MPNVLNMAIIQSILRLHSLHWSQRRIARELGIDRGTVQRCLLRHQQQPNAAISPAGSPGSNAATFAPSPGPSASASDSDAFDGSAAAPNAAIPPAGNQAPICPPQSDAAPAPEPAPELAAVAASVPAEPSPRPPRPAAGRQSECERWRDTIQAKFDQGLSAQRIWQDLRDEASFTGAYDSVKRFVRRLNRVAPLPFRRMEVAPGEEAQADFGQGAPIVADQFTPRGRPRQKRPHLFRIVLSNSRKGYSEATYRQTTDDFLRVLENAFWHFGGAPKIVIVDNLKAAVKHPDWYDPELTPKVAAFARHYGVTILPTKPRTPRHKGKVERGVGYGKDNALKGREFRSLAEQNDYLLHWETNVADRRIHGTTRKQVGQAFLELERPALLPLPAEPFPAFREAQRIVNRDGHIEVARAYYSVPPEHLGRTVWVRWDARVVRVFNLQWKEIALHPLHERGRFSTHQAHIAREKISGLERGAADLLRRILGILGPKSHAWAEAMVAARGIAGTRVLMGLLALHHKHSAAALENACGIALSHASWRLRAIRQLVKRGGDPQQELQFLSQHPIIRPLDDYAGVVAAALQRQEDRRSRGEGFLRHGWTEECSHAAVHASQVKRPVAESAARGVAEIPPPRPGYPSSGCTSAEPDSVSPDDSKVVARSFLF